MSMGDSHFFQYSSFGGFESVTIRDIEFVAMSTASYIIGGNANTYLMDGVTIRSVQVYTEEPNVDCLIDMNLRGDENTNYTLRNVNVYGSKISGVRLQNVLSFTRA